MKSKFFAFFVPSSPIHHFAIRAHSKKEVQLLINSCSNYTDKPTKGEVWYIGEFTKSEIEDSCNRWVIL